RFFCKVAGENRGLECVFADTKLTFQVTVLDDSWSVVHKTTLPTKRWFHLAITHSVTTHTIAAMFDRIFAHSIALRACVCVKAGVKQQSIDPSLKLFVDGQLVKQSK